MKISGTKMGKRLLTFTQPPDGDGKITLSDLRDIASWASDDTSTDFVNLLVNELPQNDTDPITPTDFVLAFARCLAYAEGDGGKESSKNQYEKDEEMATNFHSTIVLAFARCLAYAEGDGGKESSKNQYEKDEEMATNFHSTTSGGSSGETGVGVSAHRQTARYGEGQPAIQFD